MEGLFEFPDSAVWHLNWPTCMNLGSGCCCPLAASRCPASSKTSGALTAAFLSDRRSVLYAISALTLGETVNGVLQSLGDVEEKYHFCQVSKPGLPAHIVVSVCSLMSVGPGTLRVRQLCRSELNVGK